MQGILTSAPVLRVLVADDIEASRLHLCALVHQLGHEPIGVDSGRAALEQVLVESPDVVLLDLLMPDLDGFEVTQQIRELVTDRWLPVIVTSSLEGEEHFIHALFRGADDYLARPISPGLLDAKLRHYARVLGLQSRLATMAQRQRAIHDNILDAVITLNDEGLIEESNLAATRLFGPDQGQLTGRQCEVVLGASLTELLTQREIALRQTDGTVFPAEIAFSDWTEQGRVQHTLVIRDLTERHHIDRMKDEFLATVSHELRTPLTSVLGALGLIASGSAGLLPKAALTLSEVARRNGERLSRLIDDILDLTKLEGNQMVLQLQSVHLGMLVREALSANQGYAQQAGVTLRATIPEGCPKVRLDADRFLQVMANLLSNAIKHSTSGDTVSVCLNWSSTHASVTVRDRGPGVDPQFRARMFEKFSQADGSDRRAQGGTGLGLYITRMFVERMNGRIEVESLPGEGASFKVEFPIVDGVPMNRVPWVLHVDRDVNARQRVAEWLSPLCAVESAADLVQARDRFSYADPPIVVADPQAQGAAEEFCTALKRLAQDRLVILYSDSVDRAFVGRIGLQCFGKSHTGGEELFQLVQSAVAQAGRVTLS
jgi:PAS domain S-box-containing protein